MNRSVRISVSAVLAFAFSIFMIGSSLADEIRMDTDGTCPATHPTKHQISDASTGITYWICKTEYQWEIEKIGGDTHQKWLESGGSYDASADIAASKAEQDYINQLRAQVEQDAISEARTKPNTQVCKSANYQTVYHGSGGFSSCHTYVPETNVSTSPSSPRTYPRISGEVSGPNDVVTFSGQQTCPSSHPISTLHVDVRAKTTQTVCLTKQHWEIQLIGGEVYDAWRSANGAIDVSSALAEWKYEKLAISNLRFEAEELAKLEAEANPDVQVCKAYRYTSTFNGSGGGSVCTIYIKPFLELPELLDVI
ncbi:MAG: hypothetical protein RIS61_1145 [Actinomycetota bacterium]|jgi:hypothetical protein